MGSGIWGNRSPTAYLFREDQADDIIRVTASHKEDLDRSVIWFSPHQHAGIRRSIATPFPRTPKATSVNPLRRLPLELWLEIMPRLDMQSIFNLRQVDLRSRHMVDSVHEYQMVVTHGLNLFCALLRTRLAASVSLSQFYDALCTKACRFCGKFGGFVSLLAWERCCVHCFRTGKHMALRVQSLAGIRKRFSLTDAEAGQIKSFETLPGTYKMFGVKVTVDKSNRTVVASPEQAAFLRGSTITMETEYMGALRGLIPPEQDSCVMAVCALPYYDKQTGCVEDGVSCAGCRCYLAFRKFYPKKLRDMVFARDAFLEHFKWCEQAQILWRSSDEGKSVPAELLEVAWSWEFGDELDDEDEE